jgi:general stress protein YciG
MDPGDQLYTLDELRCWKVENLRVLDDERSNEIGNKGGASSIRCHRYFDTNHFITWFVYFLVCFGDNQLIPRGGGGRAVNLLKIYLA